MTFSWALKGHCERRSREAISSPLLNCVTPIVFIQRGWFKIGGHFWSLKGLHCPSPLCSSLPLALRPGYVWRRGFWGGGGGGGGGGGRGRAQPATREAEPQRRRRGGPRGGFAARRKTPPYPLPSPHLSPGGCAVTVPGRPSPTGGWKPKEDIFRRRYWRQLQPAWKAARLGSGFRGHRRRMASSTAAAGRTFPRRVQPSAAPSTNRLAGRSAGNASGDR